jgi:hypothetical protein
VVDEFVGAQPLAGVRAFLEPHLPRASAADHEAALQLAREGNFPGAVTRLREITQQDPANLDARRDLARCLALSGDVIAASKVLGQLPPQSQSDGETAAVRAVIHFAALASGDAARNDADRASAARSLLGGAHEAAIETLLARMQGDHLLDGALDEHRSSALDARALQLEAHQAVALGDDPHRDAQGLHVEAVLLRRLLEDAPAGALRLLAPRVVGVGRDLGERHDFDPPAVDQRGTPQPQRIPVEAVLLEHRRDGAAALLAAALAILADERAARAAEAAWPLVSGPLLAVALAAALRRGAGWAPPLAAGAGLWAAFLVGPVAGLDARWLTPVGAAVSGALLALLTRPKQLKSGVRPRSSVKSEA